MCLKIQSENPKTGIRSFLYSVLGRWKIIAKFKIRAIINPCCSVLLDKNNKESIDDKQSIISKNDFLFSISL